MKHRGGVRATRRRTRGLSLIEVIISMSIFVILAGFTIYAVQQTVSAWTQSERRRVLYERASGALDLVATDLRLAMTDEKPGVSKVDARLIADIDPETRAQRLMFVRSFETGPERALTFGAGDGRMGVMKYAAPTEEGGTIVAATDPNQKSADTDIFTGTRVGDYKALGGLAAICYFTKDQKMYRSIRAPVPDSFLAMATPADAQLITDDALYLGFDFWSQETRSWEPEKKEKKYTGPEVIWDSTRAIDAPPLNKFFLHRGKESALDTSDDVYPEKVRVTLVVDAPMPRARHTKLLDDLEENKGGWVEVDTARGFADGGDLNSYILIDGEWMRYKDRREDAFEIDQRGARGTRSKSHKAGALVRTGRAFRKIVYLPGWREDWTSDEAWESRREAQKDKPRGISK
jgi:prepilin-type N-terminal cleavage/methylation domain-containing protein